MGEGANDEETFSPIGLVPHSTRRGIIELCAPFTSPRNAGLFLRGPAPAPSPGERLAEVPGERTESFMASCLSQCQPCSRVRADTTLRPDARSSLPKPHPSWPSRLLLLLLCLRHGVPSASSRRLKLIRFLSSVSTLHPKDSERNRKSKIFFLRSAAARFIVPP